MAKKKSTKRPLSARRHLEKMTGGPLTFGKLINATRLADEQSLEAFARQLGVSRTYLCDVEKGRRTVSVERAADWAHKLGYLEAQYVALASQASVDSAGLKLRVSIEAA